MNQSFYYIALMRFGAELSTDFLKNYSLKYHQRGFRNFFKFWNRFWHEGRRGTLALQIKLIYFRKQRSHPDYDRPSSRSMEKQ